MKVKELWLIFVKSLSLFFAEIFEWLNFLHVYFLKRILKFSRNFEKIKNSLVMLLSVKRGRYNKHFLNLSFMFLVAGAIIVSPVIAQYYPSVDTKDTEEQAYFDISNPLLSDSSISTNESEKPRFEVVSYSVNKGDTLGNIAEKFGVSIDTIKWVNNLSGENLMPGQALKIPPVTGIVHKVNAGDTVYSLAKKYHSDAQKIVNFPANDFADLDTFALNIGQVVFIPDGVMPESKPVYKPAIVPQFIAGSGGKFIWPSQGSITQYPVSYHMALDIASRSAPPVASADSGVVSYAGCIKWGYGCHIIVNHAEGYQTLYGHLQSFNVSAGDNVGKGQVIGRMGSTGRSTGTHLHFEIRKGGVLLNPLTFLK